MRVASNPMTGVILRDRLTRDSLKGRPCGDEAQAGANGHKSSIAGSHQELEEAGRILQREPILLTPGFQTPGLQSCEGINLGCFKPPVCGTLFQSHRKPEQQVTELAARMEGKWGLLTQNTEGFWLPIGWPCGQNNATERPPPQSVS